MNKLRKEARKITEALLDHAGLNKAPISLDSVIDWYENNMGFNIKILPSSNYLSENGLSGKLLRKDNMVWILINKNEYKRRQRFTLAHELGHLIEAFDIAHMSKVVSEGYDRERFADIFASELLMPADLVNKEWSKLNNFYNPSIIQYKLSNIFNVSNESMGYRLNELKLQSKQWAGVNIPPVYEN